MKKLNKSFMPILISIVLFPNYPICACTGITASAGDTVLFGNNEDWSDSDTYVWIAPSRPGKFGGIYFGFGNFFAQGGMNEKGLCFDGFATPNYPVHNPDNKPPYNGNIMEECETVEQVIAIYKNHFMSWLSRCQMMYVDKTGASAIVEGDSILYQKGGFQVCTNFYQTNPSVGSYPCRRFDTATRMLKNCEHVSIDLFRDILEATHQEGNYPTQYSNIYDLKNGVVYLYHFHNFDKVITFNLAEELKFGEHRHFIPALFDSGVDNEPVIPLEFELQQNYPNPFNPTTKIRYTLDKPSRVLFNIYNIHGEKISTLVNTNQATGNYLLTWDATDNSGNRVSSGIYMYELQTNTGNLRKKMILIR